MSQYEHNKYVSESTLKYDPMYNWNTTKNPNTLSTNSSKMATTGLTGKELAEQLFTKPAENDIGLTFMGKSHIDIAMNSDNHKMRGAAIGDLKKWVAYLSAKLAEDKKNATADDDAGETSKAAAKKRPAAGSANEQKGAKKASTAAKK
ncbi:MAG: hypothetical protein CMI16_07365 [Opitutaceae bacterium]|nr:hypothetical protein [Opitutaceae bacterium]|tara:strand:- start:4246 stop:4689 length:444 start_codon:yes stop_codon:yes gene_type:complete